MHKLKYIFALSATLLLSSCGFHFANDQLSQKLFKEVKLSSGDKYSDIAIAMRKELRSHGVTLVEEGNVPTLKLNGSTSSDEVVSDRKSTRLNSSHVSISYAVFCLKKTMY